MRLILQVPTLGPLAGGTHYTNKSVGFRETIHWEASFPTLLLRLHPKCTNIAFHKVKHQKCSHNSDPNFKCYLLLSSWLFKQATITLISAFMYA